MPTPRGTAVFVTGAALAAAGYRYGYPELVALGVVATAAFVAALAVVGARPSLTAERTLAPERVTRGEPCLAELDVVSAARWRSQALVGAEQLTAPDGSVRSTPVPLIRLRAGERTFLRYPLPTWRRGVVDVGPMELARRDPLGLVAARSRHGGVRRLWVHPRSHPLRTVPVGASRSLDGVIDAAQHGSITFHALREYVPGDDLRHVHWRTSAHLGELMVREHVETSLPRIVVLLDDRATVHSPAAPAHLPGGERSAAAGGQRPDSLEEAIEAAASVVLASLRAELHVELHLVSGRSVSPSSGQVAGIGARPYLDLLAEAGREGDDSFPAAAQRLRARRRGDTLVLLTGPVPKRAPRLHAGPEGTPRLHTGAGADLEQAALLRDVYPTVVAGVLGAESARLSRRSDMIVIAARTAEEFASTWDGVRRW